MSKTGFIVTFTLLAAMGCGSSATRGVATARDIDLEANNRFTVVIDEAFEAYDRELREAAAIAYPSRGAALERARIVGDEARLLFHIRDALKAHGMEVDDLCVFTAAHPGFADLERERRAPDLDRFDALANAIANARLASELGAEDGEALAADPTINRNARAMGGLR